MWVTRSPRVAASRASTWAGIAGPGSMIATEPDPTM
jgi:hypothetical protein